MVGRDGRIIVSKIVPKNAKNFDKRTSRSRTGKSYDIRPRVKKSRLF